MATRHRGSPLWDGTRPWFYCLMVVATVLPGTVPSPTFICPDNLPQNCTCHDQPDPDINNHWIYCINTSLQEIPQALPNIPEMKFEGNNFDILEDIPYDSLVSLHLRNNNIRFIRDNTFGSLSNLKTLIVSDNKLGGLTKGTFEGLKNLQHLDLRRNHLYVLKEEIFSLEVLPKLSELDIAECELYHIDTDTFNGVSNLHFVNISHNQLATPAEFKGGAQLRTIDFSYNQITNLTKKSFDGLRNLQTIYLKYNDILYLDSDSFNGLMEMKTLNLQGNRIHSIAVDTFTHMKNLETLDLSHNRLSSLDREAVLLPGMMHISIHHNPWHCDCQVNWMKNEELLLTNNRQEDMVCATPDGVGDTSMFDADVHVFDCHDPHHGFHSNTVALAVGLLVALLAAIAGAVILYKFVIQKKIVRKVPNDACISSSYSRVGGSREFIIDEVS